MRGLADDQVCIGDRYRIGGAVFEVTQPRVTCFRVGIRMDDPRIPALLVSRHRPGFYFRVLTEGTVEAGQEIIKVASGPRPSAPGPRSRQASLQRPPAGRTRPPASPETAPWPRSPAAT